MSVTASPCYTGRPMPRQALDNPTKAVRLQAALYALRQVRLIMEASDCPEFERASIAFVRAVKRRIKSLAAGEETRLTT